MKRNELKEIVKECLIEILQEGIQLSDPPTLKTESVVRPKVRQEPARRNPLDEPVSQNMVRNPNYKQAVKQAVNIVTDDPLMQGIFADTIKTVQRQNAGENAPLPSLDPAARAVANASPDELFGGSDRWASLAFMNDKPQIRSAES